MEREKACQGNNKNRRATIWVTKKVVLSPVFGVRTCQKILTVRLGNF